MDELLFVRDHRGEFQVMTAQIASARAQMSLAPAGKRHVALSMYLKGKAFIGAYVLLRRQTDSEPVDFVALHNLCQGIEVTVKGLLLLQDFDRYRPQLKKFGHNLNTVISNGLSAFGMKPLSTRVAPELAALSNLYSHHLMRYGSGIDILIDPRSVQRERVVGRIRAAIRLTERQLRRAGVS